LPVKSLLLLKMRLLLLGWSGNLAPMLQHKPQKLQPNMLKLLLKY
jgi:hypothetical protein